MQRDVARCLDRITGMLLFRSLDNSEELSWFEKRERMGTFLNGDDKDRINKEIKQRKEEYCRIGALSSPSKRDGFKYFKCAYNSTDKYLYLRIKTNEVFLYFELSSLCRKILNIRTYDVIKSQSTGKLTESDCNDSFVDFVFDDAYTTVSDKPEKINGTVELPGPSLVDINPEKQELSFYSYRNDGGAIKRTSVFIDLNITGPKSNEEVSVSSGPSGGVSVLPSNQIQTVALQPSSPKIIDQGWKSVSSQNVVLPSRKEESAFVVRNKKAVMQVLLRSNLEGGNPSVYGFAGYSYIWEDSGVYFLDTREYTLKLSVDAQNERKLLSLADTIKTSQSISYPICVVFAGADGSMFHLKIYRNHGAFSSKTPDVNLSIVSADNLIVGSYVS